MLNWLVAASKLHKHKGYVHTVTFLHGVVLFHNPKGIPIYFQTIENDAKTLPCAHSQRHVALLNDPTVHSLYCGPDKAIQTVLMVYDSETAIIGIAHSMHDNISN